MCQSKGRCYAQKNTESTMQYLNDVGKAAHIHSFAYFCIFKDKILLPYASINLLFS